MKKRTTRDEAQIFLSDVDPDHFFYVNDGRVLRNLNNLCECLVGIEEEVFEHHVNQTRNDFYNWTRAIVKDKVLAYKIRRLKTKKNMYKKIKERVVQLKRLTRNS